MHEFSEEEVSIATTERSSFSARVGGGPSRVANLVEVEEEESSVTVPENEPANTSLGERGAVLRRSQVCDINGVVELQPHELHRTLLQRRSAAKSEEEDDVFVRPKLPARVTRSSSQRTKAKKEAKAAAKKNSPGEEGEQSASDSTSDFEELGADEAMSPQSTSSE